MQLPLTSVDAAAEAVAPKLTEKGLALLQPRSDFEWDEVKNAANILRHGITFESAATIFGQGYLEYLDDRRDYGEVRVKVVGIVGDSLASVICTQRGESVRIISARRARRDERREYSQIYPGEPS